MPQRRRLLGVFSIPACLAGTLIGCGGNPPPPAAAPPSIPAAPAPIAAVVPEPPKAPPLVVSPSKVVLSPGDVGYQLFAIDQAGLKAGRDVTCEAAWSAKPAGIVSVDASGYLQRLAPGEAQVSARLGDREATLSVAVEPGPSEGRPWSFATDIVPLFTRAGCNTGACHGRADGQNGFHLSLFGYDPEGDHQAITRGASGRRVSRVDARSSLVYLKATGRVPHGGGQPITPGSTSETLLLAWLRDGAPMTQGATHGALASIRVEPPDVRLAGPGPQQLRVLAKYADGHERDVTRLANFRVNDDSAATVTPLGHAELLRRAEADLVVRYQSQVVSTRLAAVINPDLDLDFTKLARHNFIDDELYKRLESLKVPPSPPANDAAFLRRVTLDLTGQQPLPAEIRGFLANTDPDKRSKAVDRLLQRPEFQLFWAIKFGDLLQITQARFNNGASYYHTWLREQLDKNVPWDQSVRTLLTSLGNPMEYGGGPVNYALDGPDAKSQAEQTAQRFLGLRIRCAQCHDHPFDVWTQDDYYGLAAFFAKVQRVPQGMGGRAEVKLNPKGTVEHLRTGKPVQPRLLNGSLAEVKEDEDPRKALAAWMTSPDNPYFARAMANWVWAQFFGKGLADPADDLSMANPPVHPELLDALAQHFVKHNFDVRDLIRTVATSAAYGLSSATVPGNEKDTRLFSHQIPRPLTAHQMADALAQATDVANRFATQAGNSRERKAIEIYDPNTASTILDTFGRCPRTVACASVSTPSLSLRQALLLIGGDVIESKVLSLNGYLANLLELEPEPDEIVENLYMRTVCRPPSAEEVSRWSAELKQAPKLREAAEDLFWALLNSREFAFNH